MLHFPDISIYEKFFIESFFDTDLGKNLPLGMIKWIQERVQLQLPSVVLVIKLNKFQNLNGQIHELRLAKQPTTKF